jgi:hypothetical protein
MSEIRLIYVRDASSGRWHTATRDEGKEPRFYDGCNVIGEREYLDELPEDIDPELLCKRCFG